MRTCLTPVRTDRPAIGEGAAGRWRRLTVVVALAAAMCASAPPAVADAGPPAASPGTAVAASGAAVAWGLNHEGRLGDGTNVDRPLPVPVHGLSGGVRQLAAGDRHGLAVLASGAVRSWGYNQFGQLGDGTTTSQMTPVLVEGLTDVVQVAAGGFHSVALRADGTVWTWGMNLSGELGAGPGSPAIRPQPGRVQGLNGVVQIAAEWGHTLAVRSDGTVWSWGSNSNGQLGDGTKVTRFAPVKVESAPPIIQVTAGLAHSLAVTADGLALAWGRNDDGRLGNGQISEDRLMPVPVLGVNKVKRVAAGAAHSAALTEDGRVHTWGSNGHHQLGDPALATTAVRPKSTPVAGLAGVTDLTAGRFHNLVRRPGELWGWGDAGLWPTPLSTPPVDDAFLTRPTLIPHIKDPVSVAADAWVTLIVVTAPPDFAVTADPAGAIVQAGQLATARLSNIPVNGFSQPPVKLAITGQPSGLTASLSATSIADGATATLTVKSSPLASPGIHSVTISAGPKTVTFQVAISEVGCTNTNDVDTAIPDMGPAATSGMPIVGCDFAGRPTAATVEVHIVHPRRGDLVVDLVEPNGTAHRLRDADPGDTGADIHGTFGVQLGGSGLTAAAPQNLRQLRVQDVASGGTGAIDAWTLAL